MTSSRKVLLSMKQREAVPRSMKATNAIQPLNAYINFSPNSKPSILPLFYRHRQEKTRGTICQRRAFWLRPSGSSAADVNTAGSRGMKTDRRNRFRYKNPFASLGTLDGAIDADTVRREASILGFWHVRRCRSAHPHTRAAPAPRVNEPSGVGRGKQKCSRSRGPKVGREDGTK